MPKEKTPEDLRAERLARRAEEERTDAGLDVPVLERIQALAAEIAPQVGEIERLLGQLLHARSPLFDNLRQGGLTKTVGALGTTATAKAEACRRLSAPDAKPADGEA